MSGSTSGNCGVRAHRAPPLSPFHNLPIRNELFFSISRTAFVQVLAAEGRGGGRSREPRLLRSRAGVGRDRLKAGDIAQVDFDSAGAAASSV